MNVATQVTSQQELGSRAFVIGMIRPDGTIAADDLYAVGDRLGFSTHQIRLVIARLVDEGTFVQDGRGRKAVLRTTDRYAALVEPEHDWLRMAYQQDAGLAPWDGRWTLVAFSLDEERRTARNVLREVLHAMAAAPLAGGLYAHANDISHEVSRAAAELGVADGLTVARTDALTIGGRSRPREIAEHLWPLDELAAGYRDFVEAFRPHLRRRPADPIDELAMGFEMVAAFRRCSDADPLLPPELLPAKWPGAVARDVLRLFSARLGGARAAAGVPALFSRYDDLFDDLHHPPHVRSR